MATKARTKRGKKIKLNNNRREQKAIQIRVRKYQQILENKNTEMMHW